MENAAPGTDHSSCYMKVGDRATTKTQLVLAAHLTAVVENAHGSCGLS